jgi:16S rRNA (guanine966-N2)-methyltransferase
MRVIAGRYKGRRLQTPSWDGLRPTSDKLRETLFNVLAPRFEGARVIDGYAGTGAVGIEALSRGAAHVAFVESDRRAVALVQSNLAICGVQQGYTIHHGDVASVIRRMLGDPAFDLALLDPPYDDDRVKQALEAVAEKLAGDGLVVLERPTRRDPDVPPSLVRVREVASGDSTLTFLARVP